MASQTVVHQATVSASGISDIDYFHLYFPTISDSKDRLFALTVSSPDADPDQAVTLWLDSTEQRIPGHVHFKTRNNVGDEFGLQANLITSEPDAPTECPRGLLYSPLSSCNMNCTHCISRHSRDRAVRLPAQTKQELKEHVARGQLRWIFTDYSGDIFFAERKSPGELAFLFDLGVAIHIDTNGAYLDDAAIDRVMASRVDALSISVDAAQDDTYRRIRIGAPSLDQIFESARALVAARARHGRQRNFKIRMGFTLMVSNLHELPLFIQRAASAGVDAVACRHVEVYHPEMEEESLYLHRPYFNSMRAASKALAKSLGITLLISEELSEIPESGGSKPCRIPWESAVLLANGDVMACCVPGSKMGNVGNQSLAEVWQSQAYRRLRRRVNSINPPSLCKSCQFRKSLNSYAGNDQFLESRFAKPLLSDLLGEQGTAPDAGLASGTSSSSKGKDALAGALVDG